jgi:hypothetical protein
MRVTFHRGEVASISCEEWADGKMVGWLYRVQFRNLQAWERFANSYYKIKLGGPWVLEQLFPLDTLEGNEDRRDIVLEGIIKLLGGGGFLDRAQELEAYITFDLPYHVDAAYYSVTGCLSLPPS